MIGVIVDYVRDNPYTYTMFRELRKLAVSHDVLLYADRVEAMPLDNNFGILQQISALSHVGPLISTNILNTQILNNCLTTNQKYFYVWGPEWIKMNVYEDQLEPMLYNPKIKLVPRSESHKCMMSKLFTNVTDPVMNWDVSQILEVMK